MPELEPPLAAPPASRQLHWRNPAEAEQGGASGAKGEAH